VRWRAFQIQSAKNGAENIYKDCSGSLYGTLWLGLLERLEALTWSEIKPALSPSQTNSRKKHGEPNFYDFFMRQMIS
jgi:hypothetical protein